MTVKEMNTQNLHERKALQSLDSCPLLTTGRYLHHSLCSSLSATCKPGLRSICQKNVFRTLQHRMSPAAQLSPLPGTPHPAVWFCSRLHEKPHRRLGEAAGYFCKNSNQIPKKPDPSAPFHLYAVLQHPVHRAAWMPTNLQGSSNWKV